MTSVTVLINSLIFLETPLDVVCLLCISYLTSSAQVSLNSELIDQYLSRTILPTNTQTGTSLLPVREAPSTSIPMAYKKLYEIQARIVWSQYSARSVVLKIKKGTDDLLIAERCLKKHLSLCPESLDAWILLGQTYQANIDEAIGRSASELQFRASEIHSMHKVIIIINLINSFRKLTFLISMLYDFGLGVDRQCLVMYRMT